MKEFKQDPINKAIYGKHGLMNAIEVLFKNECFIPGIMMILCCIDIMSNLVRAESKLENGPDDFKIWVKKYIHIPGDDMLFPEDVWGVRNALLHTYGVHSRATRANDAKIITWVPNPNKPVRFDEKADPKHIMVDPFAFKEAFSKGVENFLINSLQDEQIRPLFESRLNELSIYLPFDF